MWARFFRMLVCLLLAAVLVFALGIFVYNLFDQEEHAIHVVPLSQ